MLRCLLPQCGQAHTAAHKRAVPLFRWLSQATGLTLGLQQSQDVTCTSAVRQKRGARYRNSARGLAALVLCYSFSFSVSPSLPGKEFPCSTAPNGTQNNINNTYPHGRGPWRSAWWGGSGHPGTWHGPGWPMFGMCVYAANKYVCKCVNVSGGKGWRKEGAHCKAMLAASMAVCEHPPVLANRCGPWPSWRWQAWRVDPAWEKGGSRLQRDRQRSS